MGISRRSFLKGGALAAAGVGVARPVLASLGSAAGVGASHGATGSGLGAATSAIGSTGRIAAASSGDRVLVVVNLFGGNDGLNTVVPLSAVQYDRYRQLRKTLRYDQADLLPLAGEPDFALNPGMTSFQTLFAQGRLAIVNGVSVPQSAAGLFDHETGQYEYQSCDLVRGATAGPPSGWVGRWLDTVTPGQITPGIDMGGGRLMLTGAQTTPMSIYSVSQFKLQVTGFDRSARRAAYQSVMNVPNLESGVAEQNRQYRLQALQQSQVIQTATATYVPSVTYPDTSLGRQLQECAKVIYGDVGGRALAVGHYGFDTHSGQDAKSGGIGYHVSLLQDLGDSIAAFYQDLINQGHSSRVLILTVSEFGRRAYENHDKGTDHGFGSMAFVVGDAVHGGVYGLYPDLNDLVLDGNLDQTTDFRSVYSSLCANWLGADPVPIVGGSFPIIPFV